MLKGLLSRCKKSKFPNVASSVTLPGASLWHFCQKPSWHESGFLIQPGVASALRNFLPDSRSLNPASLSPEGEEAGMTKASPTLGARLRYPKTGWGVWGGVLPSSLGPQPLLDENDSFAGREDYLTWHLSTVLKPERETLWRNGMQVNLREIKSAASVSASVCFLPRPP